MEQEFLALAAGADDGHGPEARQLPRELRDIGHGGELQQQIRAGVHELRQQRQHIRLAVRQAEDLPAVLGASGRVQEDEIGAEPAQYFLEIARHQLPAAEPDVRDAELPEVLLRRLSQRRLHLVVQHLAEQPAECPAVHSHSACQIRYLHRPVHKNGLICGRVAQNGGAVHKNGPFYGRLAILHSVALGTMEEGGLQPTAS